MPSSSVDTLEDIMLSEDAELRIRNLCLNDSSDELQEVVNSCLFPHIDWILTRPKSVWLSDKVPESVIFWALLNKCYPLLQYLLLNGWDMNRPRTYKRGCPSWLGEKSVLHDIELTRWLLDHGIDPQVGSIPPSRPIQPADYGGSKGWLLYLASVYSSLEVFTLLLDRGANLEYAHALHGASCTGPSQIPIIRYLLDHKYLDVNELDGYHIPHTGTPLLAAICAGHVEVVRVLLDYGANPYARIESPSKATAMSIAMALARRDEEASKEILGMLDTAIEKWEGDPNEAPVSTVP